MHQGWGEACSSLVPVRTRARGPSRPGHRRRGRRDGLGLEDENPGQGACPPPRECSSPDLLPSTPVSGLAPAGSAPDTRLLLRQKIPVLLPDSVPLCTYAVYRGKAALGAAPYRSRNGSAMPYSFSLRYRVVLPIPSLWYPLGAKPGSVFKPLKIKHLRSSHRFGPALRVYPISGTIASDDPRITILFSVRYEIY
jgi:hypothetical protein